jgi:hypothetical protein
MKQLNNDMSNFLNCLRRGRDVVVKANAKLPLLQNGADIDIYSLDANSLVESLLALPRQLKAQSIAVRKRGEKHVQIDFLSADHLVVRFDIYSGFPEFRRFEVDEQIFGSLVGAGVLTEPLINGIGYPVLPTAQEALVRYMEYCEFFWTGPDKAHHLDWILGKLTDVERGFLFATAHANVRPRFTAPPRAKRSKVASVITFFGQSASLKRILPEGVIRFFERMVT